ncbi:hypothetical protein [Streptomyces europaeiscabiei]|nr:hypothetical protein OG858_47805 [Streptomyces europaeiscabiei]
MSILTGPSGHGTILSVAPATPGWRVEAFAPRGTDTAQMPAPSHVVAWALLTDTIAPGGARVEPVFYAGDRTWTPDQYREAYGEDLTLKVVPA